MESISNDSGPMFTMTTNWNSDKVTQKLKMQLDVEESTPASDMTY